MKFGIILICISLITSSVALAQSQTQTKPVGEKEVKPKTAAADKKMEKGTDEFASLMSEYYAAWNTLDPANAAKYYAKDPDLIFYDLLPLQYKSWKAYQTGVSTLFQNFSAFRLTPNKDLTTTRRGKIAWTTLTFHLSAKEKAGTAMEVDGRHTAIWEKRKGKWLIVHEHVSAPIPK
jgi:ketosteroid isomerase-like protein